MYDDEFYCFYSWRKNGAIAFGTLLSFLTYLQIMNGDVCDVCPFPGDGKLPMKITTDQYCQWSSSVRGHLVTHGHSPLLRCHMPAEICPSPY